MADTEGKICGRLINCPFNSSCILQGGREGMADTGGKTVEELYTEARDILYLISSSQNDR